MNMPEPNDPLDALLREQNVYVEDAGFTRRVVKSLPPRRRLWVRPVILLSATAMGSLLAFLWLPWGTLPAIHVAELRSLQLQGLLPWTMLFVVVASLILGIIGALRRED